nr:D-alanine--D-alanine ligase [uncultured bacterium]
MSRLRVALLFGGKSGEHEVSIASALSIYSALDKSKYEVTLIGIDKSGQWLLPDQTKILAQAKNPAAVNLNDHHQQLVTLIPYPHEENLLLLDSSAASAGARAGAGAGAGASESASASGGAAGGAEAAGAAAKPSDARKFDVFLPILHGPYGEDGTIQGLLDLAQVPYVGSGVLGSAVGMDKQMAKKIMQAEGIPVVPFLTVRRHEFTKNPEQFLEEAEKRFGLPYFVKPANMGSSVGVNKVKTRAEARAKFEDAFLHDTKVLVEKFIKARELEVAILGNHLPEASIIGEIVPHHEFYSYEAKYIDENGAELLIPAPNLSDARMSEIKQLAIKAFQALECSGMARVDFFYDEAAGKVYINEINTIPGFTKISMYPKLWAATGLPYPKLLDKLIDLALE